MDTIDTLADARAYIERVAADLDPDSRYVSELLAIVEGCADVADLETRLTERSRGQRHTGRDLFATMPLRRKLLANLITPETSLFRFAEGELEALVDEFLPQLETLGQPTARILIVPCSHGEEAYTVAAFFLKLEVPFAIRAFDVQPALIDEARSGRLTFGYPLEFLETPGFVSPTVLERIRFDVGDAFALPLGEEDRFDVVLCRNFVGYFRPPRANALVSALAGRLAPAGLLLLDSFCLTKMPEITEGLSEGGLERLGGRPIFRRPAASSTI